MIIQKITLHNKGKIMKNILLSIMLLSSISFSHIQANTIDQNSINLRIKAKLKELGFCYQKKHILKIEQLTNNKTTDIELEDLILEYI